jgi:hypothetical protein
MCVAVLKEAWEVMANVGFCCQNKRSTQQAGGVQNCFLRIFESFAISSEKRAERREKRVESKELSIETS